LKRLNLAVLLWGIVVCLLVTHGSYLWMSKQMAADSDILALLPVQKHDPVLQRAFTQMIDAAQQRVIVLFGADDWAQAVRAADAFSTVVASRADLLQSEETSTDRMQHDWLELFQAHRPGLLTPTQEAALHRQPKQFWVDAALNRIYGPFVGPKLGAWQDDPFGLFGEWVQARAQETPVRPREGRLYVANGGRQYVVMQFTLQVPAFSLTAQKNVIPLIDQARQSARRAVADVEIVSAGLILYAAAAGAQASREVSTIGIGSLVGIVALTWLTFRSLKPIALVLLSVGVGCLGALSVCWLLFERIHLLTLVFGATLVGGAQDYGTYFLCNRFAAQNGQLDSWQLLQRLMPALLLALVTTVIGYMGLALTPFPGLRQMAVFSAAGLIFAWLTVICWFPGLARSGTSAAGRFTENCAAVLAHWPLIRCTPATLAFALAFTVFAAWGLSRLHVDDDVRLLQNPPEHLLADQRKLSRLLDAPTPAQFYLVRGDTAETVLQREEELKQRLDQFIEKDRIGGYQAISNWVPSLRRQAARRQLMEQQLLYDGGPLTALAAQIGEDGKWVGAIRDRLLVSGLPLTPGEFLKSGRSEPWRHLWLGQADGVHASIVALRGLSKSGLSVLRDGAKGIDGVQWVDRVDELSSVLGAYRQYMAWVVLFSYAAVYALLYPRYRSTTWRVLAPTAAASVTTLALLGTAGESLQLFHVLALMLLLGIGVDYGIFLQEHPGRRDLIAWHAVALSAVSTLLSFGLLSLSNTPALQAFGLTITIGTVTVVLLGPCFAGDPAQQNDSPETRRCAVAQ